jgi:hypothetical protein
LWILEDETDGVAGKLFTVESVRRKNNNSGTVQLLEYNESVDDDRPVVPTKVVSSIPSVLPPAPNAVTLEIVWEEVNAQWTAYLVAVIDAKNTQNIGGNSYRIKVDWVDGVSIAVPKKYQMTFDSTTPDIKVPAVDFQDMTVSVIAAVLTPGGILGPYSPVVQKYVDVGTPPTSLTDTFVEDAIIRCKSGQANGIVDMLWSYTYADIANLDGFAIIYRIQKYLWSWVTTAVLGSTATMIPTLEVPPGSEAQAAAIDIQTNMLQWKADGRLFCFFGLFYGDDYEIFKVDLIATSVDQIQNYSWVMLRGEEGTTAAEWPIGSVLSYVPSEYIDAMEFIRNPLQVSIGFPQPLAIKDNVHSSIAAYKMIPVAPGYKRSNLSIWDVEYI